LSECGTAPNQEDAAYQQPVQHDKGNSKFVGRPMCVWQAASRRSHVRRVLRLMPGFPSWSACIFSDFTDPHFRIPSHE
jgi:hypothetical protein